MNKLLRSETGRALIALIALALTVALCALMPTLRLDWTSGRLVTPDDRALSLIQSLQTDVRIYQITDDPEQDLWLTELLRRYDAAGSRLTVETVSPTSARLAALSAYANGETLAEGSVLIQSDKRGATLSQEDMYDVDYDMMAYYYYGQTIPTRMDYVAQTALYNAINYVSRDDMPIAYLLTGHGETGLDGALYATLRLNNIDLQTLDLSHAAELPENADLLILSGVRTALSAQECSLIEAYLENGGHLLLMTDYQSDLTGLSDLTAHYGMAQKPGVLLDNDTNYLYSADYKHFLKPTVLSTDYTASLSELSAAVVIPTASALTHSSVRRAGLNAVSLFKTSDQAYVKANTAQLTTLDQEDADETGLFTVGMAATDAATGARLVWIPSTGLFGETAIQVSGGANTLLLQDLLSALTTPTQGETLTAPSLMSDGVSLPTVPALIALLALPLALAALALSTLLRRGRA